MNTNALKKFAQETRRKLMQQVAAKLEFVLTADTPELRENADQVRKLKEELQKTTKEQLIDKVAYTWFNRFMALRFMDANDYQPLGIRVISPLLNQTSPEILNQAKQGDISTELKVDNKKVMDILDGRINSSNPQNEAFKVLLIGACNHLSSVLPFLFERINDYTELLLPDDLTSEFSVVSEIVKGMSEEDCKEVEIIGWLYQFYISEKKDEVFASKSKVKKEDIPAATQLFTPRWIVEYMVQNTLGKLWLQNKPNSKLREHMPYFIESASVQSEDYLKVSSPEEIKLLDQAAGSGHILVYSFDLLTKIYEEEGYSQSEIASLIITKNLYGFEIDERAAQLAGMALLMKAREYQRRLFKKENVPEPNILCYKDLSLSSDEIKSCLTQAGIKASDELRHDFGNMQQATNLGSLILPHASLSEIENILKKLLKTSVGGDVFFQLQIEELKVSLSQLLLLANKYHCVVDNPPYMGAGNMNTSLQEFVEAEFWDARTDLMACFMLSGMEVLHSNGFLGMINQHTWMFNSSYNDTHSSFRTNLIDNYFVDTLLHTGPRTFPELSGEIVQNAAFSIQKQPPGDKMGTYFRLVNEKSTFKKEESFVKCLSHGGDNIYKQTQLKFKDFPNKQFGYWLSSEAIEHFDTFPPLKNLADLKKGMDTGLNDRFIRLWHEVETSKTNFHLSDEKETFESIKWVPYKKGGSAVKWYGNNDYVINWQNGGEEVVNFTKSNIRNRKFYFKESLSWSLTGSDFACRYYPQGTVFDANGSSLFSDEALYSILAILNSPIGPLYMKVLNPTLAFQKGDLEKIPIKKEILSDNNIKEYSRELIEIAKYFWDSNEFSWDFVQPELIKHDSTGNLEESTDLCNSSITVKLLRYQELSNRINENIISEYGFENIQGEFLDLKQQLHAGFIEFKVNYHKNVLLFENLVVDNKELVKQLISYSAGIIFGRHKIVEPYSSTEEYDLVDDDNIVPILDDEWFEDDIVGQFHLFLKVSFGEPNFRKNLAFVEEQIGDIRKYFVKNFYNDHIKRYKKRPIYWMFSSPKGHFNVLVYMHRYTPDTINNILNNYLREFIEKLNSQKEHFAQIQISGSAVEQTKAIKEIDKLEKMLLDCQEYEREILYKLATERIAIDLDDGVLVNYNKFGNALKEVKGLNDKATKKKVKAFDWIDVTQIR